MQLEPVVAALKILSLPEGPDSKELRKQARQFIKSLDPEELEEFTAEALIGKDYDEEEEIYSDKYKLFTKKLCFTNKEAEVYARMRIDAPGVRRVIARRALLMKYLKRNTLPKGMTFYQVAKMEDSFLKGMTDEDVFKALGVRSGMREEVVNL